MDADYARAVCDLALTLVVEGVVVVGMLLALRARHTRSLW